MYNSQRKNDFNSYSAVFKNAENLSSHFTCIFWIIYPKASYIIIRVRQLSDIHRVLLLISYFPWPRIPARWRCYAARLRYTCNISIHASFILFEYRKHLFFHPTAIFFFFSFLYSYHFDSWNNRCLNIAWWYAHRWFRGNVCLSRNGLKHSLPHKAIAWKWKLLNLSASRSSNFFLCATQESEICRKIGNFHTKSQICSSWLRVCNKWKSVDNR